MVHPYFDSEAIGQV